MSLQSSSSFSSSRAKSFTPSFIQMYATFICYASTSFSCHFIRASLSIYAIFMIEQDFISPGDFGILLSSSFMASLFVPILTGIYLDRTEIISQERYIIFCIVACFLSQLVFTYAVSIRSFRLGLISQIMLGASASSVITAQRTILSNKSGSNIAIATGFSVSVAGASTFLGKVTTAPLVVSDRQQPFQYYSNFDEL